MTGVGQPAVEHPLLERLVDRVVDDHAAERDVTGVDALRERDQVRRDAPVVDGEPLAAAAEAGHDLVGDHHDAELVAQPANPGEVARRRHQDAVGADHRLQDDRGDRRRALERDQVAQVCQRALGLLLRRGGVERRAVGVRAEVAHDAGHAGLVRPAPRVAGHGDRTGRRAVVAAVRGEDLVPAGVRTGQAHRVLGGLGATVGEEHPVEVAGRALGDQPRGLAARVVGEGRLDRAQPRGLLLDRGDQLRVLVADVDVHQLAGEVQVPLAPVVGEVRPLGRGDRQRVDQRLCRPGVEDVRPVERLDRRAVGRDSVQCVAHVTCLLSGPREAEVDRRGGRIGPS